MAAISFNTIHLHMLATGQLTTAQVLTLYPTETATTLSAAVTKSAVKEQTTKLA